MWNPDQHQAKMKPSVDRLVNYFAGKGIAFTPNDGLDNVVFRNKDITATISHHSFYRYSGIACVYKEKEQNQVEAIDVSDEMFMQNYMKPIIERRFQI